MSRKRVIPRPAIVEHKDALDEQQRFESETAALQSLRLIAAPNPKDDLSKEQLANLCTNSTFSPVLIQHLIEFIKTI